MNAMIRQVYDAVPTKRKISLWTPWGVQRVPDLEKARDRSRSRSRRWAEENERGRLRGKQARPLVADS